MQRVGKMPVHKMFSTGFQESLIATPLRNCHSPAEYRAGGVVEVFVAMGYAPPIGCQAKLGGKPLPANGSDRGPLRTRDSDCLTAVPAAASIENGRASRRCPKKGAAGNKTRRQEGC